MEHAPVQMLETIIQVRAGLLTAKAAADHLGISRKTYYQWESRALSAMLEALQPGHPGRPAAERDPEAEQIAAERDRLKLQCQDLEQRALIQRVLAEADTRSEKKYGSHNRAPEPPATA
jgi:transposase